GSALFFALILMVVITMLSALLLRTSFFHSKEIILLDIRERLIDNANSGLTLLTAEVADRPVYRSTISLYGAGDDSVRLTAYRWGVFRVLRAEAFSGRYSYSKAALTADHIPAGVPALFIPEQRDGLSLCGNTVIKGTAVLPKAGVRHAYIEGSTYHGDKLIYGEIKTSTEKFPAGIKKLLELHPADFLIRNSGLAVEQLHYEHIKQSDTVVKAFDDTLWLIHKEGLLVLHQQTVQGQILFVATKEIVIANSFSCNDIMIIAPVIKIEQGFKGSLQAFAADTIIAGYNIELSNPSALAVISHKNKDPLLTIGDAAGIAGVVIAVHRDTATRQDRPILDIHRGATITGAVISNGCVQHQGVIEGTLVCGSLALHTAKAGYKNHLLDAVIDKSRLPSGIGSCNCMEANASQKIIKWLY
ncbi:MAG: hypothetical protein RQ866_06565, partial [Bacteroidales bacterium]|nr:hypothetical protein [Bacteroidales bacterium]